LAYVTKMNILGLKIATTAVSNESLYLAISHTSACNNSDLRGRLAKAMYKLTRQNVMHKLVETTIQLWRQQTTRQAS